MHTKGGNSVAWCVNERIYSATFFQLNASVILYLPPLDNILHIPHLQKGMGY